MILRDYTQCYKYYWLESLIKISVSQKIEITFDEIINKMICEVWLVVTRFHLKLGVNIRGTNKSLLEEIVSVLSAKTRENQIESDSMIEYLIKEHESSILPIKRKLIQYVPFRTLSPF